jgi:DNA-directed RNA polymerase subunit RPC12/RpoP
MKAIIELDVPDYQIGQEVSIYFKDTMMIKAIVQEPCEDAIRRQAVLNEIPVLWNSNGDKDYCMESLRDFVTELPPVTQKSGHWIVHEKPHGIRYLECPYCNIWYLNEHLIRNSYCPNCGAKMIIKER